MIVLSYRDILDPDRRRRRIRATISLNHPDGSRGQPLIMLTDGRVVHRKSWVTMNYQVEKATEEELAILERMGVV